MSVVMSDIEEPPAKLLKIQKADTPDKNAEESQEEWLSEGVFTDDDLPQTTQAGSVDDVTNASQDDSAIHSMSDPNVVENAEETTPVSAETAENFDTTAGDTLPQPLPSDIVGDGLENKMKARIDELDEFLLKNEGDMETEGDKVDVSASDVKTPAVESDIEESPKHTDEDDDGNNTDDLLRMLGEDDSKKANVKKRLALTTVKQKDKAGDTDEDSYDEEIFEGAQIKTYKLSKNAIIRKREKLIADRSKKSADYKYSSDEEETVRKVSSKTGKNDSNAGGNKVVKNVSRTTTKPSAQITGKPSDKNAKANKHPVQTTSKSESARRTGDKAMRRSDKLVKPSGKPTKHTDKATNRNDNSMKRDDKVTKHTEKVTNHDEKVPKEGKMLKLDGFCEEELFKEEEYLEDEDFSDMNDYLGVDDEVVKREGTQRAPSPRQPIMRPERMDEDIPSDMDTEASDYSFYDELPSSDSEDVEEWFTLDIRSERAGDYIPLLGDKAETMLETEREQVAGKLSSLREGLRELSTRSEEQASEMEVAKKKLIKLDALLSQT